MSTRPVLRCAAALLVAACGADRGSDGAVPAASPAAPAPAAADTMAPGWSRAGGRLVYEALREVDLTGDGSAEQVRVRGQGPAIDSMDVVLTITAARGDTLWADRWGTSWYFFYLERDSLDDAEVQRIVRGHLEHVVDDTVFTARGLPPRYEQSFAPTIRESLQYHLAELDWRRASDIEPAEPTPPQAHDRILATTVPAERVDAVLRELKERPTFRYYAGGEASHVIAWSEREQAFVRVFSCC